MSTTILIFLIDCDIINKNQQRGMLVMKKPTMEDIAREVGVSKMTISKVFNGKPSVSSETREKVLAVAKRLNYKHNMIAGSMRSNKTNTIGLIISDSSFSFFPQVIKGIEDSAVRHGYSLLLCNTGSDHTTEKEKIDLLLSKRVDGLILAASTFISLEEVAYLSSLETPFVYTVRIPMDEQVDYVANDNYCGAYMMIDYLARTGSRKIHFFNMKSVSTSANSRLEGYKKALDKHGIAYDESIVHRIDHSIEAGYAHMKKLLCQPGVINTVFCGCDVIAVGVMQASLDMRFRIPEDVRVASYDDIEFAKYLQVPLTTVSQPKYDIGKKSVELLIKRINNPEKEPEAIILEPSLCVRRST